VAPESLGTVAFDLAHEELTAKIEEQWTTIIASAAFRSSGNWISNLRSATADEIATVISI
jgi:hypothetical protein